MTIRSELMEILGFSPFYASGVLKMGLRRQLAKIYTVNFNICLKNSYALETVCFGMIVVAVLLSK